LLSPEWNWRSSEKAPASSSTPSRPASAARLAASAKPPTSASISGCSISAGSSRVAASGTREGAHGAACEYALDPWPPTWPRPASTRVPCGRHAAATAVQPGWQSAASGAGS
jgi:hypothetical protein